MLDVADAEVTVFQGAKSASITLPTSVKNIGASSFKNCESATIVIPTGSQLMTIGANAFEGCKNLATFATANATLLNSVGVEAFKGCAKLTTFTPGAYLANIGAGAFKGTGITTLDLSVCKALKTEAAANDGTAHVGRWFTDATKDYKKNETLTTVILPTELSAAATGKKNFFNIGANAFDGCSKLVTIGTTANSYEIPAYVNTIGDEAFVNTGVTKFDLSKNANIKSFTPTTAGKFWFTKTVKDKSTSTLQQIILNKAFDDQTDADKTYTIAATDLANISTLAKIGTTDDAFQLPKGVVLVEGMFAGTGLTKLDLSKYDATDMKLVALFGAGISTLTEVKLNAKTTKLDAEAFANCTALTTLNNIDKLKEVGDGAFYRTAIASFTFGADLAAKFGGTNGTPFTPATPLKDASNKELPYSTATSISFDLSKSANVTTIEANAFKGLSMLTSVKLPATLTTIGKSAFEGTGITTIALPATIAQSTTADDRGLKENAFKDCKSLTTMTFEPTTVTASIFQYDGNVTADAAKNVFKGCSLVTFSTTVEYGNYFDGSADGKKVPVNVVINKAAAKEIKTALDKKTSGYAMKGFYDATNGYKIKTADVTTVYEAYINNGDVVLSRLKKIGDYYEIPAGMAVIVRTVEEKTVIPEKATITGNGSSLLTPAKNELKSVAADNTDKPEANYIYALTNKAGEGFAFSFYSGSKLNNGNIYVVNPKAPSAAGRMNIIFLDEDGNVEFETTAIQGVQNEAENDGEIFNLSGQKVNGAYKGIVIKNGKKMIQK